MSNELQRILEHNRRFIEDEAYIPYQAAGLPKRKMLVLTCMDTRLTELLPKAMGIVNGDAKIVKNAGAMLTGPDDDTMRGILVGYYALSATEIFVVAHEKCGMTGVDTGKIADHMRQHGVSEEAVETFGVVDWLKGFRDVEENVRNTVDILTNHPLLPNGVVVHGLVIHPETGALRHVVSTDLTTGNAVR